MSATATFNDVYQTNNSFEQFISYHDVEFDNSDDFLEKSTSTTVLNVLKDHFEYYTKPESSQKKQLLAKLDSINYPKDWIAQGIKPANVQCKKLTKEILIELFEKYELIPSRIEPSIETAYFLKYNNYINNKELIIEIYNDLEIAALINQNKTILSSYDSNKSNKSNVFKEIIKHYKSF